MTVGIGYQCGDGVVLGADKQLTISGYYKFPTNKIYSSAQENCRFIMGFSGSPDTADIMFRRAKVGLGAMAIPVGVAPSEVMISELEQIFSDNAANEEGFETLIGIWIPPYGVPMLFRTSKMKVVQGYSEYIGSGDSSAIRHLSDFLPRDNYTVDEASVLASYLVSVANRYIDGCSGGPDICVLNMQGQISHGTGGVFPDQEARFRHCEVEIGKELRALLLRGGKTKE